MVQTLIAGSLKLDLSILIENGSVSLQGVNTIEFIPIPNNQTTENEGVIIGQTRITSSDAKYGLIRFSKQDPITKFLVPKLEIKVKILEHTFEGKVHSTGNRIDRLSDMYKEINLSIGTKLTAKYFPSEKMIMLESR